MSLSTVFLSCASNVTFTTPYSENHSAKSISEMPGKQLSTQTNHFVAVLESISCKNGHANNLKSLSKIFQIMMQEENEIIKKALTKKQGFITRLFSCESWNEWTQHKTALGKVVSLFNDFLENSISPSLLKTHLNEKTIKAANDEATKVLEQLKLNQHTTQAKEITTTGSLSCSGALFLGATMSAVSHSPLPFGLASLHCITPVAADFQNHIVVPPKKSIYFEATRKIALCKKGSVVWNDHDTCNYHGPDMHITVMSEPFNGSGPQFTQYDGIFRGSNHWYALHGHKLILLVENESDNESAMYVHAENV